jgi:large subunit ribosomal protein L29
MQNLEYKEISKLSINEIVAKVSEMRRTVFDMNMAKTTSGLEKPHHLKIAKKKYC